MKQLVLLALTALALPCAAQTTTNLDLRIRVETVSGGVTNTVTTNFRYDYSTKKEALLIDGLALAFGKYRANGGTNDFGAWLRTDYRDRAKEYQDAKQREDNAALLAKLQALLLGNPDLLSAGDLSSLNTIAAKAP